MDNSGLSQDLCNILRLIWLIIINYFPFLCVGSMSNNCYCLRVLSMLATLLILNLLNTYFQNYACMTVCYIYNASVNFYTSTPCIQPNMFQCPVSENALYMHLYIIYIYTQIYTTHMYKENFPLTVLVKCVILAMGLCKRGGATM